MVLLELDRAEELGPLLLARAGRPPGPKSSPGPVDRARPGGKHHPTVDEQGIPLAVSLTGGNRNDITQLLPCSTRSRTSQTGSADPADTPTHSWPTAATTTTSTAAYSGNEASAL
ncbi:hypothetical protein [Streptomyces alfalfae]|uniref:Transposase IS4-like domain-containing protein n=1 Tax=Streptomyces alfalfae TaxID=1642299 RepID=A0A7T4PNM5_9ACTN|nr:hypothetical protein I8755_37315 [Streptomyces alfalfae]